MFKFNWHVENFSMLLQNTGEFMDSPVFEVKTMNNVKAYIRLFPKGRTKNCFVTHHLLRTHESGPFELGTEFSVSFTRKSGSASLELRRDSGLWNGFPNSIVGIDEWQDVFLSEDNARIECIIQKPNNVQPKYTVTCCAKTGVQIERHTYDLSLSELEPSRFRDQKLEYSETFSVEQHSDSFELIVGIQNLLKNNTVGIRKTRDISIAFFICCKVSLVGAEAEMEMICERHLFKASSNSEFWEKPFDIDASAMKNYSFLRFEIIVSKGNTASVLEDNNKSTYTKLGKLNLENRLPPTKTTVKSDKNDHCLLKTMYETKMFADVTLQVGPDQFSAHKCVLGSASDVFAAMFTTKMKEEETNVVHITDVDSDTISKMLIFVYSGIIENLKFESLSKLYSATDKYQILELKRLCSCNLKETLSKDTVLEVLKLADMHQDSVLEDDARDFINTNRKEVFNSDKWKWFMGKHIELAADIMLHICKES